MNEKTDVQLLRDYAEQGREDAFRGIVTRHTDFVYSAALRQVNSSDLAADIAQEVFMDLAHKAKSVGGRVAAEASLAGWLHRATRYAALNHLRDTRRQRTNERHAMEQLLTNSEPSADWEQIRPLLDEALDGLGDEDREVLLLRYFKNQDFRAVGLALGISDDAAQKRTSRAVERLREFFSRRKVTIGASGLAVLISANAVQSAPIGLATAISTALVFAGTAVSTSTAVATTALHKAIIGAVFAAVVGMGIYETLQASQLHKQVRTLQQRQAPLTEQIQQLQRARDEATNRLAVAIAKNELLKASPSENELLRLRGDVARSRDVQAQKENDSTMLAAKSWLDRVNQLKDYLKQHPGKTIPEFQFLSIQRWLNAVEAGGPQMAEITNLDERYHGPIFFLRSLAESDFGTRIEVALQKYAAANIGQFPTGISQLKPYCKPKVEALLEQLYEIKPATILPASQIKAMNIKTDWVIVRKESVVPNSTSRRAFFAGGNISWTPTPGRKTND